jgi:putative component of membrane protein insertase Oxa1/YidC/SpoIIIJ protein YidD
MEFFRLQPPLIFLLFVGEALAQNGGLKISEPSEAEDFPSFTDHFARRIEEYPGFPGKLLSSAVEFYREDIGPESIERCPFLVSCSQFLVDAVKEYGFLLGLAAFIDRNMFRENPYAWRLYPLAVRRDGLLKLDDRHFLKLDCDP